MADYLGKVQQTRWVFAALSVVFFLMAVFWFASNHSFAFLVGLFWTLAGAVAAWWYLALVRRQSPTRRN